MGASNQKTRLQAIFVIGLVIGIACQRSRADDALVEKIGNLNAVEILGCQKVPPNEVRSALQHDPIVQIASSPSAPLATLITTVQQHLLSGYLDDGFANAKVQVQVDPLASHLIVRVEEGIQYTAGPVQIVGATLANAKALESILTQPTPRDPSPVQIDTSNETLFLPTWSPPENKYDAPWIIGSAAGMAREDLTYNQLLVENALLQQGLFWADATVETDLHDRKTARLVVRILHEGPKATISEIHATGLTINTPKDVFDFAGLKPGMPVDLNMLREARKKLWDSGRFYKHDLKATWVKSRPGQLVLNLDFVEHPDLPPLSVPFPADSPEDVMLRAARSLKQSFEGGDLLTWNVDFNVREHLKVMFQSDFGARIEWKRDAEQGKPLTQPSSTLDLSGSTFMSLRQTPTTTASTNVHHVSLFVAPQPVDITILALPGKFELHSKIAHQLCAVKFDMLLDLIIDAIPDLSDQSRPITISMNAKFETDSHDGRSPINLDCSIAPVAFIHFLKAHSASAKKPAKTAIRRGVLQVESEDGSFRIDTVTGRLIQWTRDESNDHMSVEVEPGKPQQIISTDEATSLAASPVAPQHALVSLVDFLAAWNASCPIIPFNSSKQREAMGQLISKLAAPGLDSLESKFLADQANDDFTIPMSRLALNGPTAFLRACLPYVDNVFQYGDWPWTICHEALLIESGGSPYAQQELQRIVSSQDTGPVGFICLSAALQFINADDAQLVAKIGLDRLSADGFKHDYLVLFQRPGLGSKILADLLQAVVDLDDKDFATLTAAVPSEWADALRFARQTAREHPGRPAANVLAESTDQWWNNSIGKIVAAELKREAGNSP